MQPKLINLFVLQLKKLKKFIFHQGRKQLKK